MNISDEMKEKFKNKYGYIEPDKTIEDFDKKVEIELKKLAREESLMKLVGVDKYMDAREKQWQDEAKNLFKMIEQKHQERGEIPNDELSEVAIEARILLNKYYGE